VVVTSDVFVRRLTPTLAAFVRSERDFRVIDIHRPLPELCRLVRANRPAAVITEWLPGITEAILGLGCPAVVAGTGKRFPGAVSIDVNDERVGETAARFFLDSGYRHFGCVGLGTDYSAERRDGFRACLERHGAACHDFRQPEPRGMQYMESWHDPPPALRAWLRRLPKPAGIFAAHDPLGRLVCEAALTERLQIPGEIAVVGANNDELVCGLTCPPLSSVAIPWARLGALAGQWAQALIEGTPAPPEALLVEPGPVAVRQSTALTAVDDPELRRALHYLRERSAREISIGSLCKELRLSRRSLERKFAAILHSTPWETLCRIRIESARRLLLETDLPMALIAERCGFGNPERFSVVFRRQTGGSPGAFRKAGRGSPAPPSAK